MEIGLREEENDSEDKVTIGIQTYYLTLQDKKKGERSGKRACLCVQGGSKEGSRLIKRDIPRDTNPSSNRIISSIALMF